MKPREKLIKESSVIIREAFQRGFDSESVSELDNFDGFIEARGEALRLLADDLRRGKQ